MEADYSSGRANLRQHLQQAREEALRPPPKLSLAEWARRSFRLSPESSTPGESRSACWTR